MLNSPLTEDQSSKVASPHPVLEFQDISLTYESKGHTTTVLDRVSFGVERSQFVSIVGPSGCGKTSLLRMVSGLLPVQQGKLNFQGSPVNGSLHSVGIAFQNPVLLPWRNTLQNVLLPLEVVQPHKQQFRRKLSEYQQTARELLATVGLDNFQKHYPWQLSGGMKQRASLCRALIHQPEVLLLDEPFGALDAFTREDMWEMMQALWKRTQCTAMLVTHDLREALYLSDVVYVMSPRPSKIVLELTVDLPRPRTMEMTFTDEFHHLYDRLRRHIQH
ncbi:MAG: ABC transporter ATP-binding protein [Cyanobacteria bacterium J06638_20]